MEFVKFVGECHLCPQIFENEEYNEVWEKLEEHFNQFHYNKIMEEIIDAEHKDIWGEYIENIVENNIHER